MGEDYSDYSLYIKSVSGGAVKTLFECLRDILHDVSLTFDENGLKLVTMDGARCALIYMKLEASKFQTFHCPTSQRVGINVANIYKLLRALGTHDTVVLSIKKNSNDMAIQTFNADRNTKTQFNLKLLDVNSENITVPSVDFETVLTLPSTFFQRLCRDMFNLSDIMTIVSKGNDLILSCEGDFASQETVISEAEECLNLQISSDACIEGRYSLKYLTLFCKASSLSNTVEIFLKKNYPIILKYCVASLGEIRFCLAPKINSN